MEVNSVMMTEFTTLNRISTYIAKNKQQLALEAGIKNMVVEASEVSHPIGYGKEFEPMQPDVGLNEE